VAVRVVVITDRTLAGGTDAIARRVDAMLRAAPRGSVMIQIREKDLDGGPLLALTRAVLEVARPLQAPVWVNDRVDVALAAGADGVHLPERGMSIGDARAVATAVGRSLAVGCSRHTRDAVIAAAGADLVQYGPVWSTPNKGPAVGVDALAVRRELPPGTRLVAVGGIDGPARARHAALSGADAIAVIRAAWQGGPDVVARLVEAAEAGAAAR
jgi:thiamine-phosphate pyrophosphorylase